MRTILLVGAVASLSLALFQTASAEPVVTVTVSAYYLKADDEVNSAKAICGKDFFHDVMKLVVKQDGKEIAKRDYCSAYNLGAKTAKVVRDAQSKNFILLEYGEGHGTHATTTYLSVYRFTRDHGLTEVLRTEVATPIGSGSDANFPYKVETPASGGLKLVMTRKLDLFDGDKFICCIPKDTGKIIQINAE